MRCGEVRCGAARRGAARRGAVRCDAMRCDTISHISNSMLFDGKFALSGIVLFGDATPYRGANLWSTN